MEEIKFLFLRWNCKKQAISFDPNKQEGKYLSHFWSNLNSAVIALVTQTLHKMFPVPTKTWNWNCEKKPKFQIGSFCQMEQSQFQRKQPRSQGGANAFSESLDIFLILPFSSASHSSPLHVLLFVMVLGGKINVIKMSSMSVLFFVVALIRHILVMVIPPPPPPS